MRFDAGKKPYFSHGIHELPTAGYGELDEYGFWEFPLPDRIVLALLGFGTWKNWITYVNSLLPKGEKYMDCRVCGTNLPDPICLEEQRKTCVDCQAQVIASYEGELVLGGVPFYKALEKYLVMFGGE
jgi:hypothetical protein